MINLTQYRNKLSIIIPHYNSPQKLRRLLKTIPTIDEIQIIVVDDISNKHVELYEKVKEEFSDYVEFYDNSIENKSAGGARNIGLENAKGEWLLFADADDFFVGDWWISMKKYMASEADIVFFPPISIIDGTRITSDRHIPYACMAYSAYDEIRKEGLSRKKEIDIRYGWWGPWSKIIRRSMVCEHDLRFDVVKYSNDVRFSSLSGYYARSIDVAWETIYCITEGEDTLTKHNCDEKEKEFESNLRKEIYAENFKFWFYNLSFKDGCLLWSIEGPLRKINYIIKRIKNKIM